MIDRLISRNSTIISHMDNKTIETISYLARLKIDQSDKENIVKDLDKLLIDFIGQLQEINTEKVNLLIQSLRDDSKNKGRCC